MVDILVSVITPCFNSEKTIEKTLINLLNQTYQNFEYIIIDGGSTDGTLNIIEDYKEKFANKLTVVSEKDNGIYDAMNKGIKLAKGELIGIINSDDFYEADALQNVVNEYQNEKYAVFYGMLRVLKDGKEHSIEFHNHNFINELMISHPTCFVTKDIYNDFGVFTLKYKSVSDYEFMLRLSSKKEVAFKPIYKILANFSYGGISTATTVGEEERDALWYEYGIISKKKYIVKKYYSKILHLEKSLLKFN